MIFAACSKTEVNPIGGPQEISVMAVNKVATKAPVNTALYPEDYNMKLAAYLTAGSSDGEKHDYFEGTDFSFKSASNTWTGAKYWPLTSSTLNFLAVTTPATVADYTGTVSVTFGDGSAKFASKAVVDFDDNQTGTKFNQFDLMYAAGLQSNVITSGGSSTYNNVGLVFAHAQSWINFQVYTNTNTAKITVNSIRLSGASYGGILTLTNANYNNATTSTTENVTASWGTIDAVADNIYVPNGTADADGDSNGFANENESATGNAAAVVLTTTAQPFGNGLLVIPSTYTPTFTINYTVDQDGDPATTNDINTFEYTYEFGSTTWAMATKYTYKVQIKLTEIEVFPTVTPWIEATPATEVPLG